MVGRDDDGLFDVILGGVRVRSFEDELEVAEQGTWAPIRDAWRTRHGWVFVMVDGATARSESFLGPLVRLRDLMPAAVDRSEHAQARRGAFMSVLLVDREGRLWRTEGLTDWTEVDDPHPAPYMGVAFVRDGLAIAVREGGYLSRSLDGGRTWSSLRGHRAARVSAYGDCIRSSWEAPCFTRDDAILSTTTSREGTSEALLDRFVAQEAESALRTAAQRYLEPGPAWVFPDGNFVTRDHAGTAMLFRDGASGAVLRRRELPGVPMEPVSDYGLVWPDGTLRLGSPVESRFTSDGSQVEIPAGEPEQPPPWRPPVERPHPADTNGSVFADERNGVAWRVSPFELRRTRDGGGQWSPIPVRVDGVANLRSLLGRSSATHACSLHRVQIGTLVRWGWRDDADDSAPLFARSTPLPPWIIPPPWPDLSLFSTLRCVVDTRPAPLPAFPNLPANTTAFATSAGPDGEVQWLRVRAGPDRVRLALRWRGRTRHGAWVSRTFPWTHWRDLSSAEAALLSSPLRHVESLAPRWISLRDPRESSDLSVVLRDDGSTERRGSNTWFASGEREPRSARGVAAHDGATPPLPLFDGTSFDEVFSWWRQSVTEEERQAQARQAGIGYVIDAQGPFGAVVIPASRGDAWGWLSVSDPTRRAALLHTSADRPSRVALPSGPLLPCVAAETADTITIYVTRDISAISGLSRDIHRAQMVMELTSHAVCLRSLSLAPSDGAEVAIAAAGASLVGTLTRGGAQRGVRCGWP